MTQTLVSVAVPSPLRRQFDYFVPKSVPTPLAPGMRVRVAFGSRNTIAIVSSEPRVEAHVERRAYKPVLEVLDETPLLPREVLALCAFASDYYQHPLGEVFATAIPGPLRRGGSTEIKRALDLCVTDAGREALTRLPARSKNLRALLERLAQGAAPRDEITGPAVRRALEQRWIEEIVATRSQAPTHTAPTLTTEQTQVDAALAAATRGFSVSLIEGVTGSGKTELYLRRIAEVIREGMQALVLVPEIGLTPQLVARFRERLGDVIAPFHSGLTDVERTQSWLRARAGEAAVVIGTRSSVFVPFAKLGLVVVDEEHDTSYKQQDGLRYSARDLAIWRAAHAKIPAILGSATPSLESLHAAQSERYRHLKLHRRATSQAPPAIRLIDVRTRPLEGGLSPPLLEAVDRHLKAGGQVLLFQNRRGYAPALRCDDCGWIAQCNRCDARLSVHRYGARLICHHCGAQAQAPKQCPSCTSTSLAALGEGTERIEEALRARFADARVERMDSDRLAKAGELERLLADIRAGDVRILVGTQVMAKGHDFAKLSLVGIVSADQALYGTDFRALERTGQIVTQVAGRAGRAGAGEVVLQTREPSHPMLQLLLARGYAGLADALLAERKTTQMPPFAHLALLRAESVKPQAAMEFLARARREFRDDARVTLGDPVQAPMERRAGRYRAQLLLQSTSRPALQALLKDAIARIEGLKEARRARWSIDVDPADLF
jgi:primosomal protein N' (replication factor Y)